MFAWYRPRTTRGQTTTMLEKMMRQVGIDGRSSLEATAPTVLVRTLASLVLLVGCGGGAPADTTMSGTPTDTAVARTGGESERSGRIEPDTTWTAGVRERTAADATPTTPVLRSVRSAAHPGYDRLTLDFDTGSVLPGYHAEYVDRPLHECGSGRQIQPAGDGWLEIRMQPAAAHTKDGESTMPAREWILDGTLLLRVYRTCDFEGVVTLVIAVSSPNPYRILTLERPSRLAVDVRH